MYSRGFYTSGISNEQMGGVHMNYCLVLLLVACDVLYGSQATVFHISDRGSDHTQRPTPGASASSPSEGRTLLQELSSASNSSASSPDGSGDSSPASKTTLSPVRPRRSMDVTARARVFSLSETDQKLALNMPTQFGYKLLPENVSRSLGTGPLRATAVPSFTAASASAAATGSLSINQPSVPLLKLQGAVTTRPGSAVSVVAASEESTDSDSEYVPTVPSTPVLTARNSNIRPTTPVSTARTTAIPSSVIAQLNADIVGLKIKNNLLQKVHQETLAEKDAVIERLMKMREQQQNEIEQLTASGNFLKRCNHGLLEQVAALQRRITEFSSMYHHYQNQSCTIHISPPDGNAAAAVPSAPPFSALVAIAEFAGESVAQPSQTEEVSSPLLAALPAPTQNPDVIRLRMHAVSTKDSTNE